MRYLHQVLPEPGKDAKAVRGPVAAFIPSSLHQVMVLPGILLTILLSSDTISALWILLTARFLVSSLVREIRDTTMMYMQTNTLNKKILRRQSHSITLSNIYSQIYCIVVIIRLEYFMATLEANKSGYNDIFCPPCSFYSVFSPSPSVVIVKYLVGGDKNKEKECA